MSKFGRPSTHQIARHTSSYPTYSLSPIPNLASEYLDLTEYTPFFVCPQYKSSLGNLVHNDYANIMAHTLKGVRNYLMVPCATIKSDESILLDHNGDGYTIFPSFTSPGSDHTFIFDPFPTCHTRSSRNDLVPHILLHE